ncbi:MAG: beta-hydroxyacyl-ACP dehydratase [Desulfobulbaceae bacterium]|jgi:3-hydroxyacyl-[acyl-carrier-protein] dehydratase|nr:beta-hydroxyacyl-ACP dehydratase [Desulfobulbaceae bacterium]
MKPAAEILARLPHRPPFLFVDAIVERGENCLRAAVTFPADWPVFAGHYPGQAIVPGVILCEAIFQSGALLIGELARDMAETPSGSPLVARIFAAKFKREVGPGERLDIEVALTEKMASAWLMKGTARVAGKVAAQVEFSCVLKS